MCAALAFDDMTMIQHRYLVLLSACLCNAFYTGIMFGTSPLLVGILDTFRTTRVQAGLVLSLMPTFYSLTALFAGALLHKYGTWFTCCIGSAVIAIAFSVSFFASSVLYLIITVGVFAGCGLALLCISCAPAVCQHFTSRSQMISLTAMSVTGAVGAMVSSYGTGYLLGKYGLRGTCLLIGGFILNATAMSLLWRSKPAFYKESRCVRRTRPPIANTSINDLASSNNSSELSTVKNTSGTVSKKSLKEIFCNVLTNKLFMLFAIGQAINISAHHNASIYMVDAMQDVSKNSSLSSWMPVLYNLCALLGRLLFVFIKFIPHCSLLDVAIISAILGIGGCLVIALVDLIQLKLVAWCLNGFAVGIGLAGTTVTSAKLLGSEHFSTGIGIVFTVRGLFGTLGGPLNGYIRDDTGSYQFGLIYTSGVLLIVGILYTLAKVYRIRDTSRVTVTRL